MQNVSSPILPRKIDFVAMHNKSNSNLVRSFELTLIRVFGGDADRGKIQKRVYWCF
jgi:hypothetical protein